MLSHILIRDFAIIEEIDLDLTGGLSIITGETGAGKSIIIEAISMALGARADTAMVRHGCDKALIQIVVDESSLPDESRTGMEILTREISKEGKSVSRINGEIVTLSQLKEATAHIADIHGQYDHQSLLNPANHVGVLDSFRADYITDAKLRVAEAWQKYSSVRRSLDDLLAGESQSKRELDFLKFEVDEIDTAHLSVGEYERLTDELKVMQNSERIYESLSGAYGHLSGGLSSGASVSEYMASAESALRTISDISDEYGAMAESASDVSYRIDELVRGIRDKLDSLDFSEQAINDTISRLDVLDRLKSKYGKTIEEVIDYRERSAAKLENIENVDDAKARLAAELGLAESALAAASIELSRYRRKAAEELEAGVTRQLHELNFNDAVFEVAFAKDYGKGAGVSLVGKSDFADENGKKEGVSSEGASESDSADTEGKSIVTPSAGGAEKIDPADFGPDGIDYIEFLLSANKGQPPLPVAKIASGGEMSRIMLALKSVIGEFDRIPTMIFDEIDTGISGVTASIVGEKLKRMAKSRQIVCITHLPQIAAFADSHYVISKRSDESQTYTTVSKLTEEGRIDEVARLIGGRDISKTTKASARELITGASS